ncbi:protein of unknown function [Taphrina deformans PYCC 5710]|uniref:Ribosomal RNA-processing protein 41 n=1 Tax=Taphrina deformans (strain PYCC 5710 / ATCC 11124 / CBS 356.35 / IMI 108563 / JCM 9778 / NBRC 8474) TaxID=1097556 RepID=R4XIY6_TAPDE|nr:protein of unknown function [Taphrina deformans PYCC 5710]|eukprot:CCG84449.1 protein of unknown function [Taphrina deformans PYCC 5710]
MPRNEILSPEGLRTDGRRWNEARHFKARISLPTCASSSDGSSLVCMGQTNVMCTVSGPKEPSANLRGQVEHEKAFLNVNYSLSAFSGQERKKTGRMDKRTQEIRLSIENTFNEIVLLKLHPRSQIDITITVLQQDGGVVAAAINAVTLALIDAGIPMYTLVSAISAGSVTDGNTPIPILDTTNLEETDISWLTIATEGSGDGDKINFLQCETKMHLTAFESTLQLAVDGARRIRGLLDDTCRQAGRAYKERLQD